MSAGAWDSHYAQVDARSTGLYGDPKSYGIVADFLDGLDVEDWGCGLGGLKRFVPSHRYRGVDGSCSPHADEVVDLIGYRSHSPGIVLRHVLEHDLLWASILDNALASFTQRLVIVLFTPMQTETRVLKRDPDYGNVPTIGFALADIVDRIIEGMPGTSRSPSAVIDISYIESETEYGGETVIKVQR